MLDVKENEKNTEQTYSEFTHNSNKEKNNNAHFLAED